MVEVKLSAVKESRPHEYLIRFAFGGAATVLAGLVAKHFGPGAGGLFLAFPAIFPASVTLIESHEKKKRAEQHEDGTAKGRAAASRDSAGAALGCLGLFAFAVTLWLLLPRVTGWAAVPAATVAWAAVAWAGWRVRRRDEFAGEKERASVSLF